MNAAVKTLWPELDWIKENTLRESTARTWELALARGPLTPEDLERIPFTLLVPNCKVSFMAHKRLVVHVAREAAAKMQEFLSDELPLDMDTVIAGAILADGFDHTRPFHTEPGGQRQRIEAVAMIGVDVIEADCRVTHAGFARPRFADHNLLPVHDFRAAGLMNSNGKGHGVLRNLRARANSR